MKIPEALLPDIHYLFGPDSGAMLRSDSGRYFDGRLGGGFHYMEAFSPSVDQSCPQETALRSGCATEKSGCCVLTESMTTSISRVRLFRRALLLCKWRSAPIAQTEPWCCSGISITFLGSLSLFIRDGRPLRLLGGEKNLRNFKFATSLPVRNGAWNRIEVKYDFSRLAFTVNGKSEDHSFPRTGLCLQVRHLRPDTTNGNMRRTSPLFSSREISESSPSGIIDENTGKKTAFFENEDRRRRNEKIENGTDRSGFQFAGGNAGKTLSA